MDEQPTNDQPQQDAPVGGDGGGDANPAEPSTDAPAEGGEEGGESGGDETPAA